MLQILNNQCHKHLSSLPEEMSEWTKKAANLLLSRHTNMNQNVGELTEQKLSLYRESPVNRAECKALKGEVAPLPWFRWFGLLSCGLSVEFHLCDKVVVQR